MPKPDACIPHLMDGCSRSEKQKKKSFVACRVRVGGESRIGRVAWSGMVADAPNAGRKVDPPQVSLPSVHDRKPTFKHPASRTTCCRVGWDVDRLHQEVTPRWKK